MCQGKGPYYGLAFDEKRLYVARQAGEILTFGLDGKQGAAVSWPANMPTPRLIHQIVWVDGTLYVTSTGHNTIHIKGYSEFEMWRLWCPNPNVHGDNFNHLNTIWPTADWLYMIAHNKTIVTGRPSEIWAFDRKTLERINEERRAGNDAHNLWGRPNDVCPTWICSSAEGTVNRLTHVSKIEARTGGYPRGVVSFAPNGPHIIGVSQFAAGRDARTKLPAHVETWNHDWSRRTCRWRLPLPGQVFEIRCPSRTDLAYCSPDIYPTTELRMGRKPEGRLGQEQ